MTTWLDLVGALLLVVALGVLIWPWSAAGALAASGAALLALSYVIDWLQRRKGTS